MAVLKCKMCGGDLVINEESTVAECEFCGTKQTVPTADNEKKLTLFQRANRLRFACEFDKASGIYESIVAEFPEEAEAYWGLLLCKFGIEYVDDPATAKKVPTCHRSSFESIMDDSDFDQVMEYSDSLARRVYREEAKQIEDLRKRIIEVSAKEEPYDIFICYKETAPDGNRTIDSVIAQDVYDALTEKGYRVFFSRITLEDKLGQEYEPYIFAALNSAKIMLAFGTDYEYYNAVWVKNEWSRFLQLIAKGEKKALIPCYKNIDAYDMPKEFAKLQAQDMGKVGAIQDLLRGIEKILPRQTEPVKETVRETVKETVVVQQNASNATTDSLLKRAFMFLEDGKWDSADEYCEKVLDINPENAQAYLCKMMVNFEIKIKEELRDLSEPFNTDENYKKAMRFGDELLKQELQEYIDFINNRNLEKAYQNAKNELDKSTEKSCKRAAELFESIYEYKNSKDMITFALQKAKEAAIRKAEEKEQRKKEKELKIKELAKVRKLVGDVTGLLITGSWRTIGLKPDGTVVAVGDNSCGQCNVEGWRDIVAVSAGSSHTVGLKADGTVVSTEYTGDKKYYHSQCNVEGWSGIIAVSASDGYTIGLKADGTVVATEYTGDKEYFYGQRNVEGWRDIVAVSESNYHTVGLKSDGTVVATGKNDYGQCDVEGWHDIVAVSAGNRHTVGLKADGTVVATEYTGDKKYYHGQCNVEGWSGIIAVSASYDYTIGLKADGTVVTTEYTGDKWLYRGECNVEGWRDIVAVAAGYDHTVGLKADGTVVATEYIGDKRTYCGQCDVEGWRDIVAIFAGGTHTVGLKADGTIVSTEYIGDKEYYRGHCNVEGWKLFCDVESLEKRNNKTRETNKKLKEMLEEQAKIKLQRRNSGVCQHCGGDFKGLFSKKCVSCGKLKDY